MGWSLVLAMALSARGVDGWSGESRRGDPVYMTFHTQTPPSDWYQMPSPPPPWHEALPIDAGATRFALRVGVSV